MESAVTGLFGSGSSHKILYPYCTSSVLRICILLDRRDLAIASPSDCQQILAEDYATGTSAVPIACIFESLGQALRESTAPLATSAQVTDISGSVYNLKFSFIFAEKYERRGLGYFGLAVMV